MKAVTKNNDHVAKFLGQQLREERRASGLSVEQLAEKLQTDPEDVAAYESGERRVSADYLLRIAKALDLAPVTFFRFSDGRQDKAAESDEELIEEAIADPAILDEGLRLNRAFARISNADIRKTIVVFVTGLAKSGHAVRAPGQERTSSLPLSVDLADLEFPDGGPTVPRAARNNDEGQLGPSSMGW